MNALYTSTGDRKELSHGRKDQLQVKFKLP